VSARIEIAPAAVLPKGSAYVHLPSLSAPNRAGFISLLRGLLDPTGPLSSGVTASRPSKRPGSPMRPVAVLAVSKERHAGNVDVNTAPSRLVPPTGQAILAQLAARVPTGTIQLGVLAGQIRSPGGQVVDSNKTQAPPLSPTRLPSLGASPQPSAPTENRTNSAGDIAFGLQLRWEPIAIGLEGMLANLGQPNAVQPKVNPDSPVFVPNRSKNTASLVQATAQTVQGDAETSIHYPPDEAPILQPPPPREQPQDSRSLLPQTALRPQADISSIREPGVLADWWRQIQNVSLVSSPAILSSRDVSALPAWDVGPPKADSKNPEPLPDRAPGPHLAQYESPFGTAASNARDSVQTDGRVAEKPVTRSPLAQPLDSRVIRQVTQVTNDSKNLLDDRSNSESERKDPRIAAKSIPAQFFHESAGTASDGVLLDRSVEPRVTKPASVKPPESELAEALRVSPVAETTTAVRQLPLREISLRLMAPSSANVDVQVAQRAGKVQVAVRTNDQELAKTLQTNLGDLVGRLEEKGFRTETWSPAPSQHGGTLREPSNSGNSESHTQANDPGSRQGQQEKNRDRPESNARRQGRWKTQIDETLRA
jgi:hypothetical protein